MGQAIFGQTDLADVRRTARLVKTFDLMHKHPGGTLPDKLPSPADLRGFYRLCDCNEPLPLYVVQVREVSPPPGEKAITWTLLTNEPVSTFEDAWRVIGWYEKRWTVEEYHKAQKTGCQIEDMQFTTTARLAPAIALLSVVATTLLKLRDASRRPDAKTRPAATVIAPDYVELLSFWRHKEIRTDWTVHDFYFALARLGGHQNRKSDGHPGWLVLWRGWTKLQSMLDGYDAAKRARRRGKT